jgi:choline-sulfatase
MKNKKPNIVVFMTDQMAGRTLLESSPVKTPNFDRIRDKGVLFTSSHCVSPHCCPSRASFFTSLYPSENGVWNNVLTDNALSRGLFDGIKMFPEILKDNGYHNMFSGKWHVSAVENPDERGFDEVGNITAGKMDDYKINTQCFNEIEKQYSNLSKLSKKDDTKEFGRLDHVGYPRFNIFGTNENPFQDNDTVRDAVKMLKEQQKKDEPFFMYVGALGPHDPYVPPKKYLDLYRDEKIKLPANFHDELNNCPSLYKRTQRNFNMSEEEHKETLRHYYAFCSYEDALFGQVLDSIEDIDNTYIFFLSDHGDYMAEHGLWTKGLPCFSGAYDICSFVMGPDVIADTNNQQINILDFAPTILEMAGVEIPENMVGKSLLPILTEKDNSILHDAIFTQTNGNEVYGIQRAIFDKKYKYVINLFADDELYDLQSDKDEIFNLIATPDGKKQYEDVVYSLSKRIWKFAIDRHDSILNNYITIALADYGPGIALD